MASALRNLPFARAGTILMTTQATQAFRRKAFQPNIIRNYASGGGGEKAKQGGSKLALWAAVAAVGAGGGYYVWTTTQGGDKGIRKQGDYQKVEFTIYSYPICSYIFYIVDS